jgi:hypothetical protein
MKKDLLILSALFCCALIITYILVKGAEPDRIFTDQKRSYGKFTLTAMDTIAFPGRVSIMKVAQGNVYGYVYSKKTIYRYDTHLHTIDSFFSRPEIVTRIEADSSAIYVFDDTGNKFITKGIIQPSSYLITRYDTSKKIAQLKLRSFATSFDSTLYGFPYFEDGGLSADGFYVRDTRYQFYVPFYNSGIIKYDALHQHVSVIHTIDKTPPFNVAVPSGNIYNLSSKAVIVNSAATADDKYLYVLSYVLSADTDNYRGPAVDVYNIERNAYEGSFRLLGYQSMPVLQLSKRADTLIAAYEKNVLLFKLTSL